MSGALLTETPRSPTPEIPEARALLQALRVGAPVEAPACVVVAHPDDECVGLGARLGAFRKLALAHLTDGAPADPTDWRRAGLASRAAYRRARAAELAAALERLGVRPARVGLGLADQAAAHDLAGLARTLSDILNGRTVVLTHPYEGGHPDHDAAAFGVQAACALIARTGRQPPLRLEFASYHLAPHGRVTGAFWPDPGRPAVRAEIDAHQLARKAAALACFRTQAEVIDWFDPGVEAYREAPTYDFTRPPPPGAALYDGWGWRFSSRDWRDRARQALDTFGLAGPRCA